MAAAAVPRLGCASVFKILIDNGLSSAVSYRDVARLRKVCSEIQICLDTCIEVPDMVHLPANRSTLTLFLPSASVLAAYHNRCTSRELFVSFHYGWDTAAESTDCSSISAKYWAAYIAARTPSSLGRITTIRLGANVGLSRYGSAYHLLPEAILNSLKNWAFFPSLTDLRAPHVDSDLGLAITWPGLKHVFAPLATLRGLDCCTENANLATWRTLHVGELDLSDQIGTLSFASLVHLTISDKFECNMGGGSAARATFPALTHLSGKGVLSRVDRAGLQARMPSLARFTGSWGVCIPINTEYEEELGSFEERFADCTDSWTLHICPRHARVLAQPHPRVRHLHVSIYDREGDFDTTCMRWFPGLESLEVEVHEFPQGLPHGAVGTFVRQALRAAPTVRTLSLKCTHPRQRQQLGLELACLVGCLPAGTRVRANIYGFDSYAVGRICEGMGLGVTVEGYS